ncbi:MAG TPA: hypothetical protein VFT55_03965 [Planctomycetota bacterium]|nr:hypothetical protein [Planctomycetota bacterium]
MQLTPAASLLAIPLTVLGVHAPAQTFRPVPPYADVVDGHRHADLPFGTPGFRTQIVVDATHIGPNGAMLNGIQFRADRLLSSLAAQVPNVTIELSHTSVAAGSLSTTFASNVTGPTTVAFQGTVTLPQPANGFAGPLPWDIAIPFSQPFSFASAQGNLLIDIVANNPGGGFPTFFLDAVQPGGSATSFGASGRGSLLNTMLILVSTGNSLVPRLISPGHTIDFTTSQALGPPGVVALGTAQPVPIDLGSIGAPMNSLYIAPIVAAPHNWVQSFLGFASTFQLAVPNAPALVGAVIYGQSATLEPLANPLGLVLSHAVEVRLGDEFEVLPLQQLDSTDPAAPSGALLDFGSVQPEYGAVAIRFEGVFF